ncbi:helix-turn-helix domain-containing protein [Halalkalicoccus salilacus]|uniref:helix-turn-helix domain-containing protein n=1 Tax=Halalkalicoccus TaxID=332246 RepID=UPI0036167D6A
MQSVNLSFLQTSARFSSDTDATACYGLTNLQYDTRVKALSEGYFNIPRERTAEEVGIQLDVSDQAVIERI